MIGWVTPLFTNHLAKHGAEIDALLASSGFLVVGGITSIGCALVQELLFRNAKVLHVVDTAENKLAELFRDIRFSQG